MPTGCVVPQWLQGCQFLSADLMFCTAMAAGSSVSQCLPVACDRNGCRVLIFSAPTGCLVPQGLQGPQFLSALPDFLYRNGCRVLSFPMPTGCLVPQKAAGSLLSQSIPDVVYRSSCRVLSFSMPTRCVVQQWLQGPQFLNAYQVRGTAMAARSSVSQCLLGAWYRNGYRVLSFSMPTSCLVLQWLQAAPYNRFCTSKCISMVVYKQQISGTQHIVKVQHMDPYFMNYVSTSESLTTLAPLNL
jgi:hypothetical protein